MKENKDIGHEKQEYESPKVLASYDREELHDVIGINTEVKGGCGCGCASGGFGS